MKTRRRYSAQERAIGFVQSPLGAGGATFAVAEGIGLLAHMGPNSFLLAGVLGLTAMFFKDDIVDGVKKSISSGPEPIVNDEDVERHMSQYALGKLVVGENEPDDEPEGMAPLIIRYDDIKDQIPLKKMLLGVHPRNNQLELTSWQKLKCLWLVGSSSTGKSNTAYGFALQAARAGAKLIVVDQHAKKPDSLTNKLMNNDPSIKDAIHTIAITDEEVLAAIELFNAEFERRVGGAPIKVRWVLICDEMNRMARNPKLLPVLKDIVAVCGEESRGFGMYGWFLSQKAVHLKWLRDSAITIISHAVTRLEEAMLICNEDRKAARALLKFPIGRTFVTGIDFDDMELHQALYLKDEKRKKPVDDEDEEWEVDEEGYDIILTKSIVLGPDVSISRELFNLAVRMRKNGIVTGYRDWIPMFDLSDHYARKLNDLITKELE